MEVKRFDEALIIAWGAYGDPETEDDVGSVIHFGCEEQAVIALHRIHEGALAGAPAVDISDICVEEDDDPQQPTKD